MSNSGQPSAPAKAVERLWHLTMRAARSWQAAVILFGAAVVFVAASWRTVDFSGLSGVTSWNLVLAGLAYAGSIAAMAVATLQGVGEGRGKVVGSALATQLLKYVPGAVWQGQPMFAAGGGGAVGRFAGAVLAAAGLGLAVSGRALVGAVGVCLLAALLVVGVRSLGPATTTRLGVLAMAIAAGIALSGALLGPALGIGLVEAGRDVVAAWGLGVVAVPVPAGLGIREFYLSLAADTDAAAQLAVMHRALTIGIDVALGVVGFRLGLRRRA